MDLFLPVLSMMGRIFLDTFTSPLFICIFLFLFAIVSWQYKRMEQVSQRLVNSGRSVYLFSALVSTLLGLLGGFLGSILLIFIGIDLADIGIAQLWITAILLMFINPRFLCFAYAGGILSLSSLFLGYPDVNIPQLMGLIAILHMVESILILLNGQFKPVPVYVKRQGTVRGGFNLQKFWPIPLIALISTGIAEPGTGIAMPDWWPLLKEYPGFVDGRCYTMIPILAVLGYGEVSTTDIPHDRARRSALRLFLFSLSLLFLSVISTRWDVFLLAAALFSPLGHEFIIWLGMQDENRRKPIYVEPLRGLMVLDVIPKSPAERAGIKSRDIILSINGEVVDGPYSLVFQKFTDCGWGYLNLGIIREGNRIGCGLYLDKGEKLGIIPVPGQFTHRYLTFREDSIFEAVRHIWRKITNFL
ncbi:MAG: PDZ domain-containing protein [Syntrophomonadaceae bacterium]|nr:PDZ domain-containing protein [Syntrophomonadaceae bacterium]